MSSVKTLVQSEDLKSLPSVTIPVIDLSLLSSTDPHRRVEAIRDLGKACEEWGFFIVVNHEIPETLMKSLLDASEECYAISKEDMQLFETKNPRFPMKVGSIKEAPFWRDYMRFFVHPEFSCPRKPEHLRALVSEYAERLRVLAKKLLGGISESLGLEEDYIEKSMNMESMTQLFAVNYYPTRPDPESTTGLPPHSDHGLLTLLFQNGVGGLEIQHDGKWFQVHAVPGSILVNTGDQLQIISNGKYKSVMHRAALNKTKKRISVLIATGPSPDSAAVPAGPLISENAPAKYAPMSYMEYIEAQKPTNPPQKYILDRLAFY